MHCLKQPRKTQTWMAPGKKAKLHLRLREVTKRTWHVSAPGAAAELNKGSRSVGKAAAESLLTVP